MHNYISMNCTNYMICTELYKRDNETQEKLLKRAKNTVKNDLYIDSDYLIECRMQGS